MFAPSEEDEEDEDEEEVRLAVERGIRDAARYELDHAGTAAHENKLGMFGRIIPGTQHENFHCTRHSRFRAIMGYSRNRKVSTSCDYNVFSIMGYSRNRAVSTPYFHVCVVSTPYSDNRVIFCGF